MTGKNRPNKPSLHEDACLYYARELRSARAKVRERPEDFLLVAHAVEALGTSMGENREAVSPRLARSWTPYST